MSWSQYFKDSIRSKFTLDIQTEAMLHKEERGHVGGLRNGVSFGDLGVQFNGVRSGSAGRGINRGNVKDTSQRMAIDGDSKDSLYCKNLSTMPSENGNMTGSKFYTMTPGASSKPKSNILKPSTASAHKLPPKYTSSQSANKNVASFSSGKGNIKTIMAEDATIFSTDAKPSNRHAPMVQTADAQTQTDPQSKLLSDAFSTPAADPNIMNSTHHSSTLTLPSLTTLTNQISSLLSTLFSSSSTLATTLHSLLSNHPKSIQQSLSNELIRRLEDFEKEVTGCVDGLNSVQYLLANLPIRLFREAMEGGIVGNEQIWWSFSEVYEQRIQELESELHSSHLSTLQTTLDRLDQILSQLSAPTQEDDYTPINRCIEVIVTLRKDIIREKTRNSIFLDRECEINRALRLLRSYDFVNKRLAKKIRDIGKSRAGSQERVMESEYSSPVTNKKRGYIDHMLTKNSATTVT